MTKETLLQEFFEKLSVEVRDRKLNQGSMVYTSSIPENQALFSIETFEDNEKAQLQNIINGLNMLRCGNRWDVSVADYEEVTYKNTGYFLYEGFKITFPKSG